MPAGKDRNPLVPPRQRERPRADPLGDSRESIGGLRWRSDPLKLKLLVSTHSASASWARAGLPAAGSPVRRRRLLAPSSCMHDGEPLLSELGALEPLTLPCRGRRRPSGRGVPTPCVHGNRSPLLRGCEPAVRRTRVKLRTFGSSVASLVAWASRRAAPEPRRRLRGPTIELEALGALPRPPKATRGRAGAITNRDFPGLAHDKRASEIHATRERLKSEDEVVHAGMHARTRRPGDRDG